MLFLISIFCFNPLQPPFQIPHEMPEYTLVPSIWLDEPVVVGDTPLAGKHLYRLVRYLGGQDYRFPPIPEAFNIPVANARLPATSEYETFLQAYVSLFGYAYQRLGHRAPYHIVFKPLAEGDRVMLHGTPKEMAGALQRWFPDHHFNPPPITGQVRAFVFTARPPEKMAIQLLNVCSGAQTRGNGYGTGDWELGKGNRMASLFSTFKERFLIIGARRWWERFYFP